MKLSNGRLAVDLHAFSGDGLSGYFPPDYYPAGYYMDINRDIWSTVERYDGKPVKLPSVDIYNCLVPYVKLEGRYFRFDVLVHRLFQSPAWDEAFSAPFRKPIGIDHS